MQKLSQQKQNHRVLAPELITSQWFNTAKNTSLADLRGRVVAIHAFQMLCPGCVSHGLPQAQRMHELFAQEAFSVIGLHSVFEHHDAMGANALKAFIHEYRLSFPIAVDQAAAQGPVPLSMRALELRGTPSLILLDKQGCIALHHFGRADDLAVGVLIGKLLTEA
jgi:Redoxin